MMIINSIDSNISPYLQENMLLSKGHKLKRNMELECGVNTRDKNEVINSGNFTNKSEVAALSFKGAHFNKVLASDKFANFLEYADKHNQTANALVALVTAGMIRPSLTMAIPGMKDKKDKIYAATQAISSGFLGFGVTMALTKPLDDALHKVQAKPEEYNCTFLANMNKKIKDLEKAAKTATSAEEIKKLAQQKNTLSLLMKNLPEWIICVPRAMLTIALIPLILKYVFGLEKKPKNAPNATEQVQQNNFDQLKQGKDMKEFVEETSISNDAKEVSFKGKTPDVVVQTVIDASKAKTGFGKYYDKFTDAIANHFTSPIMNSSAMQKVSDKWKDSDFLFNHVATVTSAVISCVYMQRTLSNKNLEDDKKKVLAINQGLTFAISTSLSYMIDGKLNNWWERVTAKFIGARADDKEFASEFNAAQAERNAKIKSLKNAPKAERKQVKPLKAIDFAKSKKGMVLPANIDKLTSGMGILKKMAIIGIIFRLAVPLAATPLAAWVDEIRGKKLDKKKQA